MNSQTKLFQISNFNFKLNHLIIIGVLVLAFSTSFLLRSQGTQYGNELNEFDPFFNFRATEYIVENGLTEYFEWHDDKTWYPTGRNVSHSSQFMLHVTTAITYQIFGTNLSLYDYTILFPAIIGSLTAITIFGLVRLFGGTLAGLIASLLFAVSLPIILRGTIGWFKSEPLGIFYGLLGLYLFLSAIKSKNKKIAFVKIIFGAIVMSFGISSWGGVQFLIIPIGLFILALPFVNKEHKFLLWSIPLFVVVFLFITGTFERPGPHFVFGIGGVILGIPTIFLISSIFLHKITKGRNFVRTGLLFLLLIMIIGSSIITINSALIENGEPEFLSIPSFRYLNAMNPFLTTSDPLVDSIAEHASTSIEFSFLFHSVWIIFAGIGIWIILTKKISENECLLKNDMKIFLLIIGITGVYVSSVFIRLEVFASISVIILASVGLSLLTKEIFKINFNGKKNYLLKTSFITIIICLFILPLIIPENGNWISLNDTPATILTGATFYPPTNDWLETMTWIKLNTPENAKIASWWDYGYWITTLSDRTTYVDNATLSTKEIQKMATMFMSSPDDSWQILKEMDADYVLVFVAAEDIGSNSSEFPLYVQGGGGDESKMYWFTIIAGLNPANYLNSDVKSPTFNFYENTMLGKMIPFVPVIYYQPQTQENSQIYKPGFVEISKKIIKFEKETDPLKFVYASPSFYHDDYQEQIFIVIYEVNKNYSP